MFGVRDVDSVDVKGVGDLLYDGVLYIGGDGAGDTFREFFVSLVCGIKVLWFCCGGDDDLTKRIG